MMTGNNRLQRKGRGRGGKKKRFPKFKRQHKSLGGIPMKIKNGKIMYAAYVPNNYSEYEEDGEVRYDDAESVERKHGTAPKGKGDFVRRHIYEIRFDIKADDEETDEERRKREYEEWWEKQNDWA